MIFKALVILVYSYRKCDSQSSSFEVNEDVKSQAMAKNLETNSESGEQLESPPQNFIWFGN